MTKKDLKNLIDYEKQILENWLNGDLSLMPVGWNIDKQKGYLAGLSHIFLEKYKQ